MDLRGFYRGKRVLITGNTGFKGAWLSAWLESLGATVGGLSRDVPTTPSAFEDLGGKSRFATAFVDIRDLEATTRAVKDFKPDLVFHMAAQPLVRLSYANPVETWGTNVMGTVHVLEAVRQVPSIVACAVISSDKCYENHEWDFAYRENDRLGGKDPYSASKAGTEIVFRSHFESFFKSSATKVLSFRAGNVIGGGDWAADRIIPDCIRAVRAGKPAVIRNPSATRPWQHVLEPLGGYAIALARAATDAKRNWSGESFNFGPYAENSRTVGELVAAMKNGLPGFDFTIDGAANAGLHEAKFLKVSFEKANAWMGWKPTLPFEETMKWTAEGYGGDFAKHVEGKIAEFQSRIESAGFAKGW
ncbi:MAG: CDP-glucose 4,6-dehydratase [Bdellovibrionales bacterium]|nr:CDP-glucose 4,6-dehydratase [Bdellovibrionales bacterium]